MRTLEQEVIFAAQLKHPYVVQLYGACICGPELWIIMELADGGNLTNILNNHDLVSLND